MCEWYVYVMWYMCVVYVHMCVWKAEEGVGCLALSLCVPPLKLFPTEPGAGLMARKPGILDSPAPTTYTQCWLGSQAYVASHGFLYGCWVWTQVLIYRQQSLLHIMRSPKPLSLAFQIACELEVVCRLVYPYQVHNSEAVHTFTGLCDQQSPETTIEHSCSTQMKLRPLTNSGQPATLQWPLCFLCIWSFLHCVHDTYVTLVFQMSPML